MWWGGFCVNLSEVLIVLIVVMVGIVCVVKGVSEIVVGVLSFVVLLLNGLISDLCCYSVVKVFFVDVE